MDDTLSIYIIRIKGSSFYTLVQIFPEYAWARFSQRGLTKATGVLHGFRVHVLCTS